ncbi:MAG: hypothetical protein GX616_24460 [Planctomycetes bacterium]|nr:hypothetical protein [Planctomycetota bacterium]
MDTRRFLMTGLLVSWAAVSAFADAVVMYNGQRLDGQIVGETEDEVWLRQSRPDGVSFIRKIHRFNITRVEREGPAGSQPSSAPAEVEEQAPPIEPDAEKLKRLDQIISKYQQEDFDWAGFLVTQLIAKSSPGELTYMSAEVQKRLKMSLAELAANSHFKAAGPAEPGERIRLPYVTHYERSALLKLLTRAHEEALGQSIEEPRNESSTAAAETRAYKRQQPHTDDPQYMTVDPTPGAPRETAGSPGPPGADLPAAVAQPHAERPAALSEQTAGPDTPAGRVVGSRDGGASSLRPTSAPAPSHGLVQNAASRPSAWPAQRPTTAIDWLDRPEDYDGTPAQAEALVNHVQYTISLLSERIRLDTKARTDPAFKTALIQEKDRLGLLLKAAKAQAKGNLTQKERAAILAERKRLEESHRKEVVPRELLIEEFVRQGRKDGPPPGKYPATSPGGNVELVPVDISTP